MTQTQPDTTRSAKKPEACGEWRRTSLGKMRTVVSREVHFQPIKTVHHFAPRFLREHSSEGMERKTRTSTWVGIFTRNTQGTINITTIAAGSKNKKKGNEQPMIQSVA